MKEDKFLELETERLKLRKIVDSDARHLYDEIFNDYEWMKYYYQLPFASFDIYENLVKKYKDKYLAGNHFRWGIVRKDNDKLIGAVQLHSDDPINNNGKLGYIISPNETGHGYAAEAVSRIIDFAFDTVHYHRVEAEIVPGNRGSIHLIESLGMTYEGTKRESYKMGDQYYNQEIYSILNKKK